MTTQFSDFFDDDQAVRARALACAASLPASSPGFGQTGSRDTTDVIRLATFILEGRDPWDDPKDGDIPGTLENTDEADLVVNLPSMTAEEAVAMLRGIIGSRTVDLSPPATGDDLDTYWPDPDPTVGADDPADQDQ